MDARPVATLFFHIMPTDAGRQAAPSQGGKRHSRRAAGGTVALGAQSSQIAGYYTLSASGVPLEEMPEDLAKRLSRYPSVPVARMGRLAVDQPFHGQKLGAARLCDAPTRAARSEVMVDALVVEAKDARAEAFYRHHGFAFYRSQSRKMILPLAKFKTPQVNDLLAHA